MKMALPAHPWYFCHYPDAPARQLPEAIRLWREAEAAERARP